MEEIISRLKNANHVMFITGAGVSSASGIPTYRGIGGIYNKKSLIPPEILLSKMMWKLNPRWVWKHLHKVYEVAHNAVPNSAHECIMIMQVLVNRVTVVTQNVDGLHRAAGSEEVIELHGSADSLLCEKCGHKEVPDFASLPKLPKCPKCNHVLRPPVVLFGEALPSNAIEAFEEALNDKPDIVIVVGTTGSFPYIIEAIKVAKDNGSFVLVIDPVLSDTLAPYTDLWMKDSAENSLLKIVENIPV